MKITRSTGRAAALPAVGSGAEAEGLSGLLPWLNETPKSAKGGKNGPAIKKLQTMLRQMGFDPGPSDGWFGPKTAAAVRKFQQAKGLVVDANVGPQTWGALGLKGAPRNAPTVPTQDTPPANPKAPSSISLPPTKPPAVPEEAPEPAPEPAPPPSTPSGKFPKPPVVSMPSPHQGSRDGAQVDTIVLHHTAGGGTAQETGVYMQQPNSKVSAHYVIGKDGTIVQAVDDERRAWHAGVSEFQGRSDVNDFSIGIEIVNWGDGKDPYPDAQYKALAQVVLHLQDKFGIPTERIIGHKDVALPRGRKVDPSANFSWDKLQEEIARLRG